MKLLLNLLKKSKNMTKFNYLSKESLEEASADHAYGYFYWSIALRDKKTGDFQEIKFPGTCRDSIGVFSLYSNIQDNIGLRDYLDSMRKCVRDNPNLDTSQFYFVSYHTHKSELKDYKNKLDSFIKVLNKEEVYSPTEIAHFFEETKFKPCKITVFKIDKEYWKSPLSILLVTFFIRGFCLLLNRDVSPSSIDNLVDLLNKNNLESTILNHGRTFKFLTPSEFLLNLPKIIGSDPLTGFDDKTYIKDSKSKMYLADEMYKSTLLGKGERITINGKEFNLSAKGITYSNFFGGMGPVSLTSTLDFYLSQDTTEQARSSTISNPITSSLYPIWAKNLLEMHYAKCPPPPPKKIEVKKSKYLSNSALSK